MAVETWRNGAAVDFGSQCKYNKNNVSCANVYESYHRRKAEVAISGEILRFLSVINRVFSRGLNGKLKFICKGDYQHAI
ncbi:hypothetical protein Y032_0473g2108 [Ancylostoma ceylanicum]|uniref:Uncharacterized protein n=1 Tax=Ancylostoma ceylanicum TaxID=53326 RepID=A0A016WWY2_9BILA|nr:hypothetical protein Y032_0473g2108 [Ancylostoma ceylanicum]